MTDQFEAIRLQNRACCILLQTLDLQKCHLEALVRAPDRWLRNEILAQPGVACTQWLGGLMAWGAL